MNDEAEDRTNRNEFVNIKAKRCKINRDTMSAERKIEVKGERK
jgi:hypothetical protein